MYEPSHWPTDASALRCVLIVCSRDAQGVGRRRRQQQGVGEQQWAAPVHQGLYQRSDGELSLPLPLPSPLL